MQRWGRQARGGGQRVDNGMSSVEGGGAGRKGEGERGRRGGGKWMREK